MGLYRGLSDITAEVDALQARRATGGANAWSASKGALYESQPLPDNFGMVQPQPLELKVIDPRQKAQEQNMEGYTPNSALGGVALGSGVERTTNLEGYNPNTLTEQDVLSKHSSLGMEEYTPNSALGGVPIGSMIENSQLQEDSLFGDSSNEIQNETQSQEENLTSLQFLIPNVGDSIETLIGKLKQLANLYMLEAPTNIGQGRWRESELETERNYYNPQPNKGYPVGV